MEEDRVDHSGTEDRRQQRDGYKDYFYTTSDIVAYV